MDAPTCGKRCLKRNTWSVEEYLKWVKGFIRKTLRLISCQQASMLIRSIRTGWEVEMEEAEEQNERSFHLWGCLSLPMGPGWRLVKLRRAVLFLSNYWEVSIHIWWRPVLQLRWVLLRGLWKPDWWFPQSEADGRRVGELTAPSPEYPLTPA